MSVDVRLLGPLEVVDDEGAPVTPAGLKERSLLVVLALDVGRWVSADRLVDVLWGERPPANPANALQARVSALRRSLKRRELVEGGTAGYRLLLDPGCVDVHRFESQLAEARRAAQRGATGQALSLYERALVEWRGDEALTDFVYEEFARGDVSRLTEERLTADEERLGLMIDHGRAGESIPQLERAVERFPLRERLWGLLMLALYRTGRQAEALRTYTRAREALAEELGIEPSPELVALEESILLQDPALAGAPAPGPQHNLPARVTSFLGRAREIEELMGLVTSNRLVTLVGPGGVGKTSLATAVAGALVPVFTGGVWLVELAALADPDLLGDHIARSLGLRPMVTHGMASAPDPLGQVQAHLTDREGLLVLDNCEHLIDPAARIIDRLVHSLPSLSVLATSREPLRLGGEIAWQVPPLGTPSGDIRPEDIDEFDAVRLFVERARAARPEFVLDETTAPAVSMICSQLDGLPLAIELAAARTRSIPVRELAARVHDRFRLLTGGSRVALPRHQTLRAAIDWSHDLLGEDERTVFRRLSVFAGGCTLDAAEAVCAAAPCGGGDILDLVGRLVDRSLLMVTSDGDGARYRLLETVRQYAAEQLESAGESEVISSAHAHHYVDLVEHAHIRGPEQPRWIRTFDGELDNLRSAVATLLEGGEHRLALRLAGRLGWYWFYDRMNEGKEQLDTVLAASPVERSWERALALQARAMVVFDLSPEPVARAAARESMMIFDELDDPLSAAESRCLVALDGWFGLDPTEPLRLLGEASTAYRIAGDVWGEAFAEFVTMLVTCKHHDLALAISHGERSIELFEETGDPWALTAVPAHLGEILRWRGDYERAMSAQQRALEWADASGLVHVRMYCLHELGQLAAHLGNADGSRRWFEQGLEAATESGFSFWLATFGTAVAQTIAHEDGVRAASLYRMAEDEGRRLGMSAAAAIAGRADLALAAGRPDEARRLLRDGALQAAQLGDPPGLARCLAALTQRAHAAGDHEHAARLLGRLDALLEATGMAPIEGHGLSQVRNAVRAHLGPDRFDRVAADGATAEVTDLV